MQMKIHMLWILLIGIGLLFVLNSKHRWNPKEFDPSIHHPAAFPYS